MILNKKDFLISVFIALIGAFLVFYFVPFAVDSPGNVKIPVMDPVFWPNVISWMIMLIGVSMIVACFIGSQGESSSERGDSLKKEIGSLFIVVFFAAYYFLLPDLGMVWASSLAYLFLSFVVFRTKYRVSAAMVSVLLPIALYGFFYHVAGVNIPQSEMMRLP